MKHKSKGADIMVSDHIDEKNGFLALTDEEHRTVKEDNPAIKRYACEFLEYGKSKEEYWTQDKFMEQMKRAVAIANISSQNSSVHTAHLLDYYCRGEVSEGKRMNSEACMGV